MNTEARSADFHGRMRIVAFRRSSGLVLRFLKFRFSLLLFLCLIPINVSAQPNRICPLNIQLPADLTIRDVKVTGRRGVGPVEKKLKQMLGGRTYTRELHHTAMAEVESALTNEINESFEKQSRIVGGASHGVSGAAFLRTDPCAEIDPATKSITVIVRVLFLRLDLDNLASNLLTLPRSLQPSFYDQMPAILRAFNPTMDVDHDRRTGPVAALSFGANLAELPDLIKGRKVSNSDLRLDLNFDGEKALSKRFHRTQTNFVVSRLRPSRLVEQLDFSFGLRADDQPLSELRHVNNELRLAGQVRLRPREGVLNSVFLSGRFNGKQHDVHDLTGRRFVTDRNHAGEFRGIVDGRIVGGFARAGVWIDSVRVRRANRSYQRLASLFGYQKEIGKGTQTLGVEALFGAGKSWGRVPIYANFFGGNNAGNFLYDSPGSPTMTDAPTGPYLRSYGRTQAAARSVIGQRIGGESYWHANFTLAIPVRRWSRRLIPDEVVTFENGDIKLNTLLENFTIKTAIGTIGDDLLDGIIEDLMKQDPTLTEDEAVEKGAPIAEARARKIVEKDIAPNVRFIARHANLFAVKPLLMFDAAQIRGVDGGTAVRRYAAGAGLQLVVVIARAEMGYMKSLSRFDDEPKGNFVFRLTFQNLF